MSVARQLYDIFYESCTHYSVARVDDKGKLAYHTVEGIPTLALIEQHIAKEIVLGAYTVLPGNMVRWMAFDVDSKLDLDAAKELAKKICDFLGGISYIVEWSGSKGYHILIIFKKAYPAAEVKAIGDAIHKKLGLPKSGDPHVEVFPKQDKLSKDRPLGNLLRLPLGMHPATEKDTFFADYQGGWETGPELDPEELLARKVDLADLAVLVEEEEPLQEIASLLTPFWTSGQRHHLALCVSGYLANLGWSEENVLTLIEELYERTNDGDLDNQLEAVTDTFKKVSKGQKVLGFQGLAEILPSKTLQQINDLATSQVASPILHSIDRIRLGKGAQFIKVRNAAKTVVSYFKENGELVRDSSNIYWLDSVSHELLMFGGKGWDVLMHNTFGLNPLDSFGRQVIEAVKLFSFAQARLADVYKRSFWNGKILLINLGGPEVYILNGNPKERMVIFNGERGILFHNSEDRLRIPNLQELDIETLDVWEYLANDISFEAGDKVNATAVQQRELFKAFVVATFFAQIMPTRPILTVMADAGAGKTTTARRVLRFIEGPYEDVLGVVQDKPDSLRSSIASHKVLVLDNLEKTKAHWLTDILNRISTGSHIEMRVLRTTNDMMKIIPDCWPIITATNMPFSEETVYSRILPLQLAKIVNHTPEHVIQQKLLKNHNAYWKGMLDDLDAVVAELNRDKEVGLPSDSRLADFTVFCAKIADAKFLDGKELLAGLASLTQRQKEVLQANSPLIPTLESWLRTQKEEAVKWHDMAQLYLIWSRVASVQHNEWRWSGAQGLARHTGALETQWAKHYGLETRHVHQSGRDIKQYRFLKKELSN